MPSYKVSVVNIEDLKSLEGDWGTVDFVAMLDKLGVEGAADLSAAEAEEMCLLALQDLELDEAATAVLEYKLADKQTAGQIQNHSHECQFEKLWEHGGHMELHRAMFSVGSLLALVNEQHFPTPDAVRVTLELTCASPEEAEEFAKEPTSRTFVRLAAAGMTDDAVLNRLFADVLDSGEFPEADLIMWDSSVEHTPGDSVVTATITSSAYWLDDLRETETFEWTDHPDAESS